MDIEFSNLLELKQRLLPALRNRKRLLKKQNVIISEEELWIYFTNNYWKNAVNLSLFRMVDDILNKEVIIDKQDDII